MNFVAPHPFKAKLQDKQILNDKYTLVTFELSDSHVLEFQAGQYLSLKVADTGERRAYSIFSSPAVGHAVELLIDVTPNGVGTHFLQSLELGAEVECLGPLGRFTIETAPAIPEPALVLIATGSGLAPFNSMVLDLLQVKHDLRPIILYWGERYETDLCLEMEFTQLSQDFPQFSFHPVLSRPAQHWKLCAGHVTDCLNTHGIVEPAGYYLCGGRLMIEDVTAVLTQGGVDKTSIHQERFY